MPIYEFQCAACGEVFDRLQKLSDPDPVACPACGKAQVQRKLSAPSFRLAGSGWYETDFKGDKDKRRNLAGGDEGPPAAKPAESAASGSGKGDAGTATGAAAPAATPAPSGSGSGAAGATGSGTGAASKSGGSGSGGSGSGGAGPASGAGSAGGGAKAKVAP